MKNLASLIFILLQLQGFAQQSNLFSLTISNNGQIENLLEYYKPFKVDNGNYYSYFDDYKLDHGALKLNLSYERGSDSSFYWLLKGGIFLSKENFEYTARELYKGQRTQNAFYFSLGRVQNLEMKKFIFSLGLETAFHFIGDFKEDHDETYNDSITYWSYHISKVADGGFGVSLNGILTTRYFFSNHFFIRVDITAGWMYSNIINKYSLNWNNGQEVHYLNINYKSFTPPEFHFGFGFKL